MPACHLVDKQERDPALAMLPAPRRIGLSEATKGTGAALFARMEPLLATLHPGRLPVGNGNRKVPELLHVSRAGILGSAGEMALASVRRETFCVARPRQCGGVWNTPGREGSLPNFQMIRACCEFEFTQEGGGCPIARVKISRFARLW